MLATDFTRFTQISQHTRGAIHAATGIVLIAGNGHVDRKLGVPTHLGRDVRASVLVLVPVPAPGAAGSSPPADAVWMTPTLPKKDYCAELKAPAAPAR